MAGAEQAVEMGKVVETAGEHDAKDGDIAGAQEAFGVSEATVGEVFEEAPPGRLAKQGGEAAARQAGAGGAAVEIPWLEKRVLDLARDGGDARRGRFLASGGAPALAGEEHEDLGGGGAQGAGAAGAVGVVFAEGAAPVVLEAQARRAREVNEAHGAGGERGPERGEPGVAGKETAVEGEEEERGGGLVRQAMAGARRDDEERARAGVERGRGGLLQADAAGEDVNDLVVGVGPIRHMEIGSVDALGEGDARARREHDERGGDGHGPQVARVAKGRQADRAKTTGRKAGKMGAFARGSSPLFHMSSTTTPAPLTVIALASPVYWPDTDALRGVFAAITAELSAGAPTPPEFHLLHGAPPAGTLEKFAGRDAVLLPLSGGIQPILVELGRGLGRAALANAYLPGFVAEPLAAALMHRNAHPACTDFFAHQRLAGRPVAWLGTRADFDAFARAQGAVAALRAARILQIGPTEPWVINSTRDPGRFRAALGCEVVPVAAEELYAGFERVADTDAEARALADDWWSGARARSGAAPADALKAARVAVAMRRMLAERGADALSMACFSMIGAIDTTSCLALSTLNDSAGAIGACEGDLDAAATLYLLKKLGADFVWIANPIVHAEDCIDLAHCTAPRRACGAALPYRLLRHHESGRGVAPEVALPGERAVTLARVGANLTELCVHRGRTESVAKQPTCHTQIRVSVPSSRRFLDTLNGTHVVMSYGDFSEPLAHCARLLGLRLTGSTDMPGPTLDAAGRFTPRPVCACVE